MTDTRRASPPGPTRFFGGSVRRRTALIVGLITIASFVAIGATAGLVISRSLRLEADADLRATSEAIRRVGLDEARQQAEAVGDPDSIASFGEDSFGLIFQLLDDQGRSVDDPQMDLATSLPIGDAAVQVATGQRDEAIESVDTGGRVIRVITLAVDEPDGVTAMRVGTDVTSDVASARRAWAGITLVGLLAGIVTAGLVWFVLRRMFGPLEALANAADGLRRDKDVPERIDGEGPDEVGRLVTSFNAMLDDLQRSRIQQGRLVADASHELRTPLTSLGVKIEFIQAEPDLDPAERQRLLAGARSDLGSLRDLVSELIELASDARTAELPVLTEMTALLDEVVGRFAASSGRTVHVDSAPAVVETRPKQVARALANVLVNADKYSPAGQPIVVRQRGPRIEVRDFGPGIPPDLRERVFDRFYRGPQHHDVDGSGLGLSIVAAVADSNNGSTWIDDPVDGGPGVIVGFSAGPTPPAEDRR